MRKRTSHRRNLDGLDLTTLTTLRGSLREATDNNGSATTRENRESMDLLADVENAIEKKRPGSTFTQASFAD